MSACCSSCGPPTGACTCTCGNPRKCPSPTCWVPEIACDLGHLNHETCPTWRAQTVLSLRSEIDDLLHLAERVESEVDLTPGANRRLREQACRLVAAVRRLICPAGSEDVR